MNMSKFDIFAVFLLVCLLATAGTASAYDDKTIEKAEKEILKTGDYMFLTAQMVGALDHYNLTASYNGVSIFDAYEELELDYRALAWKFLDFDDYSSYPPDEAYQLAVEMKGEAEAIKDAAEETLKEAGYSKGTIHEEKVLVMGGTWLSRFTTAFIAAFGGYSPTVAKNTKLRARYEPSCYDIIVLDDHVGSANTSGSSFENRNLKRVERILGSDRVGIIFMKGAMSAHAYNTTRGVFSHFFQGGFEDGVYVFNYNYTLKTNASAPPEFNGLDSTWGMSGWGAWAFTLPPELQNQKVILNLEWPAYNCWNVPVYGRPVATAFTYGDTKLIASGVDSYLVKPFEPPYVRDPVAWLSESPGYEKFLTASLEHVAPSKGR